MISLATRPARRRLDESIVPMINVIFLLLLFFMVAGNLSKILQKDVQLPHSEISTLVEPAGLTLVMDRAGAVSMGGRPVGVDTLGIEVAAALTSGGQAGVVLRADADVLARDLLPVLEALKRGGVGRVSVVTRVIPGDT